MGVPCCMAAVRLPALCLRTHKNDFFSQRGKGGMGLERPLEDQMSLRFPVLPRFHSAGNTFTNQLFLSCFGG